MRSKFLSITLLVLAALLSHTQVVQGQGTVFTYQGRLTDNGTSANGNNYGMVFYLYDAPTGGNQLGNMGIPSVSVSNGLFTVSLDFGASAFTGTNRWLEVTVQKNGGSFTTLTPRQMITPTPYAIMAQSASNFVGNVTAGQLGGSYSNAVSFTNPGNVFVGDGSGLTNLPTHGGGYLFAFDTNTQSVVAAANVYQTITFSTPGAQLNGWTLSPIGPGSSIFTATASGIYLIQYEAEIQGTDGRTASLRATLNNIDIPGSQSAMTLGTGTVTAISKSFIAAVNAGGVLRLQIATDGAAVSLQPGGSGTGTTRPSVSLTITRIN
jgi:hypothetical protein